MVERALRALQLGKTADDEGLTAELLQALVDRGLPEILEALFHKSQGYLPEVWGRSTAYPIYKIGDAKETNNYRVVVINHILHKLYSTCCELHLRDMDLQLPNTCQAGFRKGKRCSEQTPAGLTSVESVLENTPGNHPAKLAQLQVPALLFADDLVLISRRAVGMQKLLESLARYCDHKFLVLNLAKTKSMSVCVNTANPTWKPFLYRGEAIEDVDCFKYLGVMLYKRGSLNKNAGLQIMKAKARTSALHSRFKERSIFVTLPKLRVFDACVVTKLFFSVEIWASTCSLLQWDRIERVQTDYLRSHLRLRRQTCTQNVLAEYARYPLQLTALQLTWAFMDYAAHSDQGSLLQQAYQAACELAGAKNLGPVASLRAWMEKLGISPDLPRMQPQEFTKRIRQGYLHRAWRQETQITDMVFFTQHLPDAPHYKMQEYLARTLSLPTMQAIGQFRLRSTSIRIIRARGHMPRAQRICLRCTSGKVDDEAHMFSECAVLTPLRDRFPMLFEQAQPWQQLVLSHPKETAAFLRKAYEVVELFRIGEAVNHLRPRLQGAGSSST